MGKWMANDENTFNFEASSVYLCAMRSYKCLSTSLFDCVSHIFISDFGNGKR